MEKESEFQRLEKYVERLLENFAGVKAENRRLEYEMQKLLSDNAELKRLINVLETDKGEISSRVESLIGKIESWESELETADQQAEIREEPVETVEETDKSVNGSENNEGSERGGGVQTSLFAHERSQNS